MLISSIFITSFLALHVVAEPEMYAHPRPDPFTKWIFWKVQPTLIYYLLTEPNSYVDWTNKIDQFLQEYTQQNCDNTTIQSTDQKSCNVDLSSFGPCTKENHYGYNRGAPCIFLTLEKVENWVPEFYDDVNDLPDGMPNSTVDYIKTQSSEELSLNHIWVSCEGDSAFDVENVGAIEFFPAPYFGNQFFPYKNQQNYLSPVVAVQLKRPILGVVLNVRCNAWAKNIHHNKEKRIGTVDFDIFID